MRIKPNGDLPVRDSKRSTLARRRCTLDLAIDFVDLESGLTNRSGTRVLEVCKTEASAKPVPMDIYMADDLRRWRRFCAYPEDSDCVFASPRKRGNNPTGRTIL